MSTYKYDHTNDKFYHSKEWKRVRKAAIRRDKGLCVLCLEAGEVTPATTVHHIRSVRTITDGENYRFKELYDLKNLITVCPSCHNKLHKERSFTRAKKKRKIRTLRDNNIFKFHINRDF